MVRQALHQFDQKTNLWYRIFASGAPVAQRIERLRPKERMGVQFFPGAHFSFTSSANPVVKLRQTSQRDANNSALASRSSTTGQKIRSGEKIKHARHIIYLLLHMEDFWSTIVLYE